ncbi:MAG: DivIVA domain-containing protein [Bacteroidetes bacterium]|nr:DivIVA domain-containing protein [Bacteroidota bacterium]
MKLSALDIKKQDFKKAMRGYEPAEVRAFLDIVSSQWESVMTENREQALRLAELETQLKDYRQVEKVLHQTMLNAEETSRQTIENARQQSQNMIKEAEIKGLSIIEAAKRDVADLRQQIQILKSHRMDLINRLKGMVELLDKNVKEFELQHSAPQSLEVTETPDPVPAIRQQPAEPAQVTIFPKEKDNPVQFEQVGLAEPGPVFQEPAKTTFVPVAQELTPAPARQEEKSVPVSPTKEKINLDHILNQLD